MKYSDDEILINARKRYFAINGFPDDGGYSARWVKIQLGPIPFFIPNSSIRVRAVRIHDLHHVLTEYDTSLIGEAEVGAWELASGCKGYLAAWVLNLAAVAIGMFLAPGRVITAFRSGIKSNNLYGREFNEALLNSTIGKLRDELGLADRE